MSGLEFFLTRQVYSSEMHSGGWDKHVYDDENIHYYLLQTLLEGSVSFAQAFLRVPQVPANIRCTIKPERGIFDMVVHADTEVRYVEVKIWARLNIEQLGRQIAFLREKRSQGIHLLLTKAADAWPAERVKAEFGVDTRVIGANDLINCLQHVALPTADLVEVADAYRAVLTHLSHRWPA